MSTTRQVYELLLARLGPQHWWPGESPLEVLVGAVLVQNTSWQNVARALASLREAGCLDARRIVETTPRQLEQLVRSAGYYRVKAKRLRALMQFVVDRYGGCVEAMCSSSAGQLREELLAVHGVGPETADSILLYALNKPAMVVDTYTKRIWARHGWIDLDADYHQLQAQLDDEFPDEVAARNELHALLVRTGNQYCKKTKPRCDACPLSDLLPVGGICAE
jgi:endonuclease-3 related protein